MSKVNMWKCGSCGAPNPQNRGECYSCNQVRQPEPIIDTEAAPGWGAGGAVAKVMETNHVEHYGGIANSVYPYCAGGIAEGVRKCRHCGEWLDLPLSLGQKIFAAIIAILFPDSQ